MEQEIPFIYPETHLHTGWVNHIQPDSRNGLKALCYSRLRLQSSECHEQAPDGNEHALVCLAGTGVVFAGPKCFELKREDSAFIPAGVRFTVEGDLEVFDLAIFSVPADPGEEASFIPIAHVREGRGKPQQTEEVSEDGIPLTHLVVSRGQVASAHLCMGLTSGQPGTRCQLWPQGEEKKSTEKILVVHDLSGHHLAAEMSDSNQESGRLVLVLKEGDALAVPERCLVTVTSPWSPYSLVWATP